MNNVLVTGLAIGKEIGSCNVCNFDLSWLFNNPSVFLWADKIIITPVMWDSIINEKIEPNKKEEFSKTIKFLFERLNSEGIIEICKPNKFIDNNMFKFIGNQVARDMEIIAENFPTNISLNFGKKQHNGKRSPDNIKIGDYEYCPPYLISIYGGLLLSRLLGAQPLFNKRSFEYLKYRFGIDVNDCQIKLNTFNSIFNVALPNDNIFPEIVLEREEKCSKCIKETECKKNYIKQLDNRISDILNWRKYDEIFQIKSVVNNIINDCNNSNDVINVDDIIKKYHEKENKINKLIKSTFPKVNRFANISTLVSLPFAVVGAATNSSLLITSGLAVTALAQASKEVIELLESKFRWVGFLNKKIE
jgi:hypothetical protein